MKYTLLHLIPKLDFDLLISCIQLVYSKSTPFAFWIQLFFLCFSHTSRALLDIQLDIYKCVEKLKFSSSMISSLYVSLTLLALPVAFLKIACLHVSFTAYENFYKLSKNALSSWLLSTFSPSEVSKIRNSTIKHISTYTLVHSSIITYMGDHFLVIFCP